MKKSQLRHLAALAGVPFTESATLNESAETTKTAIFSGYAGYMRSRAPNVFKQHDIKVVSKDYDEDEDIIEYKVRGDKASLDKARKQLESNEKFGGVVFESANKPSKKKEFHQASLERAIKSIQQAESDVSVVFRGTDVGDDYKEMFKELLSELDADLDDLKNRED